MNTKISLIALLGVYCAAAHAVTFPSTNKYDHAVNAVSTNLNRSSGSGTTFSASGTQQMSRRFDSSSLNNCGASALGAGYQISSVESRLFVATVLSPDAGVSFHFNKNAPWQGDVNSASIDPATDPNLVFNSSLSRQRWRQLVWAWQPLSDGARRKQSFDWSF